MLSAGDFIIRTIDAGNGNAVSVCPLRGGIITSLKLKGKEILYFDPQSLDSADSIRGGIPILFPNAGESETMPRHGFARDSQKWEFTELPNGFTETLNSDNETKSIYLYDFKLEISEVFSDSGFTLTQKVTNTGTVPMPIAMGMHPYFKVLHEKKKDIQFQFQGKEIITRDFDVWNTGGTVVIDNPNSPLVMEIPDVGKLTLTVSEEYKKLWLWSAPESNYVCIEPMMRSIGGYDMDPYMLDPHTSITAKMTIVLD